MSYDNAAKYGLALLIGASLFYLVLVGKMDASTYLGLATAGLGALGMHSAIGGKPDKPE